MRSFAFFLRTWFITTFFITALLFDVGFAGWVPQQSNTNATLNAVSVFSETGAVIVGDQGVILHTTTGGEVWNNVQSPTSNYLSSVHMINQNIGYACGYFGTIIKTTNGGLNWSLVTNPSITHHLNAIKFLNEEVGYTVGTNGSIYKTTNGGVDWSFAQHSSNKSLRAISISPSGNLYIGGGDLGSGGIVLRSTNMGLGWILSTFSIQGVITAIQAVTDNIIEACATSGYGLRSTNGGSSWNVAIVSEHWLYALDFLDPLKGMIVGGNVSEGAVYQVKTGSNWAKSNPIYSQWIYGVDMYSDSVGWMVGYNGKIYKYKSYNLNFTSIFSGVQDRLNSVKMIDSNLSYIVGANGRILITTTGGNSWNSMQSGVSSELYSVSKGGNKLWVVGEGGVILKSELSTNNWVQQTSNTSLRLSSVSFATEDHGVAVGDFGTVLYTKNGGTTWVVQNLSLPHLRGVVMVDTQTVYAVGGTPEILDGYVIKSTDGGVNWNSVFSGIKTLTSVHFFSPTFGIAIGIQGTIITTIDGGATWNTPNNITGHWIYSAKIIDEQTIVAVGGNTNEGYSLVSADYGRTWETTPIAGARWLYGCDFIDISNGIACGEDGKIFSTQVVPGGLPVELRNYSYSVDDENVIINWSTATETNNSGFEIFRNSARIGFINGKGTTTSSSEYRFEDINAFENSLVYTVFQIDYDGSRNHLFSIEVERNNVFTFSLSQNYPNPFNPNTKINYSLNSRGVSVLEILDVNGKLIETRDLGVQEPGFYSFSVDMGTYSSGVYFYRLTQGKLSVTRKMILMK